MKITIKDVVITTLAGVSCSLFWWTQSFDHVKHGIIIDSATFVNNQTPTLMMTMSNRSMLSVESITFRVIVGAETGLRTQRFDSEMTYIFSGGFHPGEVVTFPMTGKWLSEWGQFVDAESAHTVVSVSQVVEITKEHSDETKATQN